MIILQFGDLRSKFGEIRRVRGRGRARASSGYRASLVPLPCVLGRRIFSVSLISTSRLGAQLDEWDASSDERETRPRSIARASHTFSCGRKRDFFPARKLRLSCATTCFDDFRVAREPQKKRPYSSRLGRDWQWERAIGAFTSRAGFLRSSHTISLKQLSHNKLIRGIKRSVYTHFYLNVN